MRSCELRDLGVMPYGEALAIQKDLAARRKAGEIPDQLLLLAQNPFVHTLFVRVMSGMLRHMQFLLRSALVDRLQHLALAFYEEKQSSALQTKILRDVEAIDGLCRHLMHSGLNGVLVVAYVTVIALIRQPLVLQLVGSHDREVAVFLI